MDGNHGEKHPKSSDYVESGIPFLMAKDIKNNKVDIKNCTFISKETAGALDKGFAKNGDILLTHKATIGEVGILEGVNTEYAMLTPQITYYRILDFSRLDRNFFSSVLRSSVFQKNIHKIAKQSTRPYVGITEQRKLTIYFPIKIEEQQKIGSFFKQIDETIALHQRKLDKLKRLKQGYLQRLFPQNGEKVPRLRFTNFERDWKLCEVGNSAFLRGRIGFRGYKRTDLVPPHQGAITFSPSDIDNDGNLTIDDNDYISLDKYYESPEIKVKSGDILFTKTASIGKIAYVHELKEKATINPQFALLTPNKTVDNYFLFQSLRHPDFLKKVKGITGGSSVQTMSQEKLKDLVFFVPALDEQIKVSDLLLNLNRRILLQQSKIANLKSIKQALLQKMFI
ncbi:restriction endonuclease subunit S [Lactococcus sp. KTH0-1S]|uniref:restriction endonuclease subunit S n=1 Tax=Lactococcus sp. KTH0-1S TaxID=3438232 RepID=UPI00403C3C7B